MNIAQEYNDLIEMVSTGKGVLSNGERLTKFHNAMNDIVSSCRDIRKRKTPGSDTSYDTINRFYRALNYYKEFGWIDSWEIDKTELISKGEVRVKITNNDKFADILFKASDTIE